jgi:DNA-binding transcriptional regulator YhcF (GntR family)
VPYKIYKQINKSCGCQQYQLLSQTRYQGVGDLSGHYFANIKQNAKSRNISFNITIQEAWNKLVEQKFICAISGIEIYLAKHHGQSSFQQKQTASLDRIDSNLMYTIDNIQWVHKVVNRLKGNLSHKELIWWCQNIISHNKEYCDGL